MNVDMGSPRGQDIDLTIGMGHLWRSVSVECKIWKRRICVHEWDKMRQVASLPQTWTTGMKLKFRHKVFLTFLLNSLAIVICMLLIWRYFAFRNFEEYIKQVDTERLSVLSDALSQEYRKNRSWDPVLNKFNRWLKVTGIDPGRHVRPSISNEPDSMQPSSEPSSETGGNPENGTPPAFGRSFPPPPPEGPPAFDRPFRHPPGPPHDPGMAPPRISLFDGNKLPLSDTEISSADGYRLEPITVDGETVGWLGISELKPRRHPPDLEFIRGQSQTFYSIAGVALLLAVVVTFILSRHLLAPVKELAQGTQALTSRRFETRLKVRSQDELGQLAADFNGMAGALERYERLRRQWLADISHELRTPLAVLRGEIEAMQDGVREVSGEALESLHFEVVHLGRIVHDLHDLSLIESQALDAERTAVNPLEVLEDTLKSFNTRLELHNIKIVTSGVERVTIMADADRLKQLFSNLLENALRYAQSPGMLKISHELTSGRFSLHFEDSGPGVPEESIGRLFDRLYRVDTARSRAQGGSGLGLAICKGIVECFGGRIEASNGPEGGLRISIVFPVLPG